VPTRATVSALLAGQESDTVMPTWAIPAAPATPIPWQKPAFKRLDKPSLGLWCGRCCDPGMTVLCIVHRRITMNREKMPTVKMQEAHTPSTPPQENEKLAVLAKALGHPARLGARDVTTETGSYLRRLPGND